MYPTPVWYTPKYLVLMCVTAAAKLILFLVLKKAASVYSLRLVRLMATDSALDFCIGCTTVLTLLLSKNGKYAFDALCGIAISIFILISAVKGIINAVKLLLNYKSKEKREEIHASGDAAGTGSRSGGRAAQCDGHRSGKGLLYGTQL